MADIRLILEKIEEMIDNKPMNVPQYNAINKELDKAEQEVLQLLTNVNRLRQHYKLKKER